VVKVTAVGGGVQPVNSMRVTNINKDNAIKRCFMLVLPGARFTGRNNRKWLATNCRTELVRRRQKSGLTAFNQAASQTK
jgi:hypothetical protein